MTATSDQRTSGPIFHGANLGYVLDLYDRFLVDPASVDADTRDFFATWTPPEPAAISGNGALATAAPGVDVTRVLAAATYAQNLRSHGHRVAATAPIDAPVRYEEFPALRAEAHGLREADLRALPASVVGGTIAGSSANALEATERLKAVYCGTIGYEFDHVQPDAERQWLRDAVESGRYAQPLNTAAKRAVLERLTQVEAFERFLHTAFLGAKRFSIEGTDALVPVLDTIISGAAAAGTREVVVGMAHRGRLNVLTHVLGKPYEQIINEFGHGPRAGVSASDSADPGWTGDVKYHLGARRRGKSGQVVEVPVIMAPNPSHLEYVNPVVEGMARASQDDCGRPGAPLQDPDASLAIVLHGDAAFPGQGIVAETLNLSNLRGYTTGGTLHVIVNNQVGYTTNPEDSRSTIYASDLAKGFEIPIVHVNADDPEACLVVARLALDYRNTFHQDFLIDLIGYRRWGHNEGDDPSFTQPLMYQQITGRPTVRALWAQHLEAEGVIQPGEADRLINEALDRLQAFKAQADAGNDAPPATNGRLPGMATPLEGAEHPGTAVPEPQLRELNEALHTFPDGFTLNSKLDRQLQRRRGALDREGAIDWALAESLAFASIIAEGTPVRLTGQDAERGTFAQRHLVLHDPTSGATHTLLHAVPQARASFAVHNSPLSEAAVLGFEYGYSVYAPDTLVLWEAQFGDFANSAQVIIDQFIVAAQAKWRQTSSLVLLLPHGYEGQGPEHSSARLERFLQLAADGSIRVANCTTSAQYFHLLRRQAKLLKAAPRPLVVMTPKSLLRHALAGSSLADLAEGRFQPVIDDLHVAADARERVTRVVLCSGKVYVDLAASPRRADTDGVAVVRIEELHPFPAGDLRAVLDGYPGLSELIWLQEEPKNMGAWRYIAPLLSELAGDRPLRYVGRPERASPAEGSADIHAVEQARIVEEAFSGVRALELSK
jgi:2-oxoglutarate dehydrogenase E1 component